MEAIKVTKNHLNQRVPLIGFAGAPWTIFAYMVEGQGSKTFSKARRMLYSDPETAHRLLTMITETTKSYFAAQIQAGVDMIQIFDSWGGILSPELYDEFSLPYIKQLCGSVSGVPVTVFAKGAYFARRSIAEINCDVLGLDWNMDIAESKAIVGNKVTLQGNLDPCCLYGSFQSIERATKRMIDAFGPTGHIANLGHGVYPDTEADKVRCFIDTVKEYSERMSRS